jgi:hypothetical protein
MTIVKFCPYKLLIVKLNRPQECVGLTHATVGQLIDSLNDWTLSNCRSLNVSRCTFIDRRKTADLTSLSRFQQLTSLNLSGTEFNKASLEMVVQVTILRSSNFDRKFLHNLSL